MKKPLALIIMDGFGLRKETEGNAIAAAKHPTLDRLWETCPPVWMWACRTARWATARWDTPIWAPGASFTRS